MRNLTLAVSEEAHRRARIWAAQHDTSISALMSYCLENLSILPIIQRADAEFKTKRDKAVAAENAPSKS
jgi:hypothetical protein